MPTPPPSPAPLASAPPPPGRLIPFDFATGATYALGLTYADHIRETGEKPGQPVVFLKRCATATGEGAAHRLDFWSAAKSLPGFLPVSPRVWCPDGPSPETLPALVLETHVNGALRQSASTTSVIYPLRHMLQVAAATAPGRTLRQHDLVLTGTPAGITLSVPLWKRRLGLLLPRRQRIRAALRGVQGNPRFLQPGNVVRVSAGWLGGLECTITSNNA